MRQPSVTEPTGAVRVGTTWRQRRFPGLDDAPPQRQRDGAADGVCEGDFTDASASRDAVYRRLLGAADLIAATAAFVFAIPVLGHDSLGLGAVVVIAMVIPICKLAGLYERDGHLLRKSTLDEAPTLFYVATLYTLLAFLAGENIVDGTFGRYQALAFWGLMFVLMLAMRTLARCLAGALVEDERCVILGNADAAHWLATKLERNLGKKVRVVGRIPLSPDDVSRNELPMLGRFDALEALLAEHSVDRALIARTRRDRPPPAQHDPGRQAPRRARQRPAAALRGGGLGL